MSESKSSASGGIGLAGAVFVVFLVLKLAEIGSVSSWSWWWVTSPLWIPAGLVLGGLAVFLVIKFFVMVVVGPIVDRSNRRQGRY